MNIFQEKNYKILIFKNFGKNRRRNSCWLILKIEEFKKYIFDTTTDNCLVWEQLFNYEQN